MYAAEWVINFHSLWQDVRGIAAVQPSISSPACSFSSSRLSGLKWWWWRFARCNCHFAVNCWHCWAATATAKRSPALHLAFVFLSLLLWSIFLPIRRAGISSSDSAQIKIKAPAAFIKLLAVLLLSVCWQRRLISQGAAQQQPPMLRFKFYLSIYLLLTNANFPFMSK